MGEIHFSPSSNHVLLVFHHRPCPTAAVLRRISHCFHRGHRIAGMAPDPSRQNPPDRPRRQNLRTLHLPRLQVLPVGVRQESHRSCHFPNLSLRISSPMPNQYLARLVSTPPDQLKQEERDLLHTWKNAIYEDVIHTVKNVSDWLLFKDKQDLPKLLRALVRRDLPTLAQTFKTPRDSTSSVKTVTCWR